jgi:Transglycosylase-like domain
VTNASLRLLVVAGVVVMVVAALTGADNAHATGQRFSLLEAIDDHRQDTWRWQRLMQVPRTPTTYSERTRESEAYRRWVLQLWRERAERAEDKAQQPPNKAAWLCLHRYEALYAGGWQARTGNGYYGGLQMDMTFQRYYAPELLRVKGTADRWSAVEQMWVAERAVRDGRGFHPWPNSARACGLI